MRVCIFVYIDLHIYMHTYIGSVSAVCPHSQLEHRLHSPGTAAGRAGRLAAERSERRRWERGWGEPRPPPWAPAGGHCAGLRGRARRGTAPPPAGRSAASLHRCGRLLPPSAGAQGCAGERGAAESRGREPGPARRSVSFPWRLMRALI